MKRLLKHKKLLFTFIAILIVIIVLLNRGKGKEEPANVVNVLSLSRNTLEQIISVKAPLEGVEKAEVTSALNYEIKDIRVKEGDIVQKDQILAVLDSDELEKQISTAENQIQLTELEQQNNLKTAQINYEKDLLQLSELEDEYNKNKDLLDNDIITEETFKDSENKLKDAKKSLESYKVKDGKVVLEPYEIKQLEIKKNELNQKKEDLEKIYIKSPIPGTVTRVNVNLGRYANDTEDEKAMFVVENLEKLQMKVSVSEFDIGKIKVGQEAEIYSDILGSDFAKGVVARISPTAEEKDNNNMDRIIPVLIDITEKPDNLIAGVIATAKIKVDSAENVFAVPSGAFVQDENGDNKIFVLNDDNTIKSVKIDTGLETDLQTEIKSSELKEGTNIVINPTPTFTDGMIVTPNAEKNIQ